MEIVNASSDAPNIQHSKERAAWDEFVSKINKSLDKLQLEFRHLHDEDTGKEIYALVNRMGDEIAQMATEYTPAEIAFFKAVVEQIMLAPRESFSVSSLAALRELSAIKPKSNMTKTQAEVVLSSFVAKGWLLKSKRGRYSLSTRSLLELLPYLKSTYPEEIVECTICMEIITRGVACFTANCKTRLHYHCFATYRRRQHSCPSCSKEWPREAKEKPLVPVGEDAAKDGDDGKRRVRLRSAEPSDDEEDTVDEDEQPSQSQAPSGSKNKRRPSRKTKPQPDESMDIDEDEADATPPQRNRRGAKR